MNVKGRKNYTREEREGYVQAWRSSGLSQNAFAIKVGISGKSLYRWVKQLGKEKLSVKEKAGKPNAGNQLNQCALK